MVLGLVLFLVFSVSFCPHVWGKGVDHYFLRLREDEFAAMMLPRERFLVTLVRHVHDELSKRKEEGGSLSRSGFEELVSPETRLRDRYSEEVERVLSLAKELETLERQAKRRADLTLLQAIGSLKRRLLETIGGEGTSFSPDTLSQSPRGEDGASSAFLKSPMTDETEPLTLFEQWRYNQILEYRLKYTKYELYHTRLLREGTPFQRERMFKRELKEALLAYSKGDYALAWLLFGRLLETYPDRKLDDVLFYAGESAYALNHLDDALECYTRLAQAYPDSEYLLKSMIKRFAIFYLYRDYESLFRVYHDLEALRTHIDPETFFTLTYLTGHVYLKNGNFEEALTLFIRMSPSHPYYYPALYLAGTCLVHLRGFEAALPVYQKIATELESRRLHPVLGQIRNNALLKWGLILYEMGKNQEAISVLDRVTENSAFYDLGVMGKAWSAYRAGRPGEALMMAERVLQGATVSGYVIEARLLAARAKEYLGQKEEALEDLKRLYQITQPIKPKGGGGVSPDMPTPVPPETNTRDDSLLQEARRIARFLDIEGGLESPDRARQDRIRRELAGLDTLERAARGRQDVASVERIRTIRAELLSVLKERDPETQEAVGTEEMVLIAKLGLQTYLTYLFDRLIQEIRDEKRAGREALEDLRLLAAQAQGEEKIEAALRLEIRRDEMASYLQRLNRFEIWLLENRPETGFRDYARWARLSGYGISNLLFNRIRELDMRIQSLSLAVRDLDGVIKQKRLAYEERTRQILEDISRIEEALERETRKREAMERDRYFQDQYFDRLPKEAPVEPRPGAQGR